MKKNLVKKVLCFALSLTVIMAMMPAVFADDPPTLEEPGVVETTVTISGTVRDSSNNPVAKEVTVLVLRPGVTVEDIASYDPTTDTREPIELISYIDQITSNADGTFSFVYSLGDNPEEGTYTVLVGGTDIAQPSVSQFTVSGGSTPTIIYGDIDGNTTVSINDAVLVMQAIVGTYELDSAQTIAADVDGNEAISINDAVLIMQYIVGTLPSFPVENAN